MKKIVLAYMMMTILLGAVSAQEPQITNVFARQITTLNGKWKYVVDPYETGYYDYRRQVRDIQEKPNPSESLFLGYKAKDATERVEYDFDKAETILVPRDWNSQKEKLFYYEGTVWYYKKFDYQITNQNNRQFLYIGAANYQADVYLNGKKLGKHIGGFTPFNYEITGKLNPKDNFVIIKVDNKRGLEQVPTVNTDWWNYGGLTRDVMIIEEASTFVEDYYIQLSSSDKRIIDVKIKLNGTDKANQQVEVTIPEASLTARFKTNANGVAEGIISAKSLNYWSPENPKLYNVSVQYNGKTLTDKIGFRSIDVKGSDILVNGKSTFLRGICIHEENGIRGGRAYSREDAQMLLGWAKELGCNFVRLAHYPHNENMLRVADELGLMVWSEVPVYWTIQWQNKETLNNAITQLSDMITRDKNRASIIIWSMANETPISQDRTKFLKQMIDTTRSLDHVRLVSAALERHYKAGEANTHVVDDPLEEYVDVISFNQYIGWYDGTPEKCKLAVFDLKFNKPVIISEFGGGALQGLHGDKTAIWTEEYQEELYKQTLLMLDKIPQFRGVSPWILADFRSPRRVLPDVQDGWNRKGVISETGNKKKAYFVLQDFYKKKALQFSK